MNPRIRNNDSRLIRSGRRRGSQRRGFTLIELVVASVVTAFVLGSVSLSMFQLGRAKNSSKMRFDAHIRADAALNALRKDIISVLRSDDLFYTRLLLINDSARGGGEEFDRDEILVFNTRVRPLRNIDFGGEGSEYETQYRIAEDDLGPALWVRNDAMPDEYPMGGGTATPTVEGVLGLSMEVYDGYSWYDKWDSDIEGLPLAVRITVWASGNRGPDDVYDAPRAVLRTVVPIDRVLSPKDLFEDEEPEAEGDEELTPEEALDEAGAGGTDQPSGGGIRPGGGRPGGGFGGRPGGGTGGGGGGPTSPTGPNGPGPHTPKPSGGPPTGTGAAP